MYLRNAWYVAARSEELADKPLARTIMGEPLVFWRTAEGAPAALEDSCAHRYAPLSLGCLVDGGARIRCGYHGVEFDATGACVRVPGQTRVPPGAAVRRYPVVERWRWIWIWPGDPALADPATIPAFPWHDDPGWTGFGARYHVNCDWRLLVENLLDLSHVAYVHASTIGTDNVADFPVKVRRERRRLRVERWIRASPAPPLFQALGGFAGDVDRWQLIRFDAPSHFAIDVGAADAGSGAPAGDRSRGITMMANHTLTPETERSCHYFWHHTRSFRQDDAALTGRLRAGVHAAIDEDVVITEAQQLRMEQARPGKPIIDINADAGVLQARRILDEMAAAERPAAGQPRAVV